MKTNVIYAVMAIPGIICWGCTRFNSGSSAIPAPTDSLSNQVNYLRRSVDSLKVLAMQQAISLDSMVAVIDNKNEEITMARYECEEELIRVIQDMYPEFSEYQEDLNIPNQSTENSGVATNGKGKGKK